MAKTKKPSKSGAVELSEEELGDAHGGLLLPAVQKVTQKKKASTLGWKVSGFDGKGND